MDSTAEDENSSELDENDAGRPRGDERAAIARGNFQFRGLIYPYVERFECVLKLQTIPYKRNSETGIWSSPLVKILTETLSIQMRHKHYR